VTGKHSREERIDRPASWMLADLPQGPFTARQILALCSALALVSCAHAPGSGTYKLDMPDPRGPRHLIVLFGDGAPPARARGCPRLEDSDFNGCYVPLEIGRPLPLRWQRTGNEIDAVFCDVEPAPIHLHFRIGQRAGEMQAAYIVGTYVVTIERVGDADANFCRRELNRKPAL
jgi:hypothetical protein